MQKFSFVAGMLPALGLLFTGSLAVAGPIAVKDGQRIAFLGDSITEGGWGNPVGYVRLVLAGLATNGVQAKATPAGISGHKSNQMLERLDRDVLAKKPDWMTLSCGVNDVWHGEKGVPLDQYKTNIATIVARAQAAGVKVVLLTSTPIGENLENANNAKLAPYNEYLRALAREKDCLLADLSAAFAAKLKALPPGSKGNRLTSDGVHMNPSGNQLMAVTVLRTLGLDEAQLKSAEGMWKEIPGGANLGASFSDGTGKPLAVSAALTLREQEQLEAVAVKQGRTLNELLQGLVTEEGKRLLKPSGEFATVQAIFEAKQEKEVRVTLQKRFRERLQELLKK